MKAGRLLFVLLSSFLLLIGGYAGCGKKADPRPSHVPPLKTISDLSAKAVASGVILRWSVPDAKGGIQNFKILRSELSSEGTSCIDCPRDFSIIADISSRDPQLTKVGENIVSYLDSRVRTNYIYSYRLIACDMSGICSEASDVAEVTIRDTKENQRNK
jgi:hypothetical protein